MLWHKRRMDAVRPVVEEGWSQGAAARRVKAAPQSVSRWVGAYRQSAAKPGCDRPDVLDASRARCHATPTPDVLLLEGPEARLPGAPVDLAGGSPLETSSGSHTTQATSGRSCERSSGARNAWSARRASATKCGSAAGSARPGRALKKSSKRRPYARLHRRKRIESEAASLPHLGATWPNTGAAV